MSLDQCNTIAALFHYFALPRTGDENCCRWDGVQCEGLNVTGLNWAEKKLKGSIPADLAKIGTLKTLFLYRNELSGNIPTVLGRLAKLKKLDLGGNQLEGGLPVELSELKELEYLSVASNRLNGPVPAELGKLWMLEDLRLSNNSFTGNIPTEFSKISGLRQFSLDNNALSGPIMALPVVRFQCDIVGRSTFECLSPSVKQSGTCWDNLKSASLPQCPTITSAPPTTPAATSLLSSPIPSTAAATSEASSGLALPVILVIVAAVVVVVIVIVTYRVTRSRVILQTKPDMSNVNRADCPQESVGLAHRGAVVMVEAEKATFQPAQGQSHGGDARGHDGTSKDGQEVLYIA